VKVLIQFSFPCHSSEEFSNNIAMSSKGDGVQ